MGNNWREKNGKKSARGVAASLAPQADWVFFKLKLFQRTYFQSFRFFRQIFIKHWINTISVGCDDTAKMRNVYVSCYRFCLFGLFTSWKPRYLPVETYIWHDLNIALVDGNSKRFPCEMSELREIDLQLFGNYLNNSQWPQLLSWLLVLVGLRPWTWKSNNYMLIVSTSVRCHFQKHKCWTFTDLKTKSSIPLSHLVTQSTSLSNTQTYNTHWLSLSLCLSLSARRLSV